MSYVVIKKPEWPEQPFLSRAAFLRKRKKGKRGITEDNMLIYSKSHLLKSEFVL